MRKFLIPGLGILIIGAMAWISSCTNNDTTTTNSTANNSDSAKAVLTRGEYLVTHVAGCIDCHSKRDFHKFSGPINEDSVGAGGMVFDMHFGLPGVVYSKNITSDTATGIGKWTDAEILRAMTQGISRNGDTLFPLMPYTNYNHMAKEDLMSIIAYIRTLKPIQNVVPKRQLMVPIAAVYPAPFLQPSVDSNRIPPMSDAVHYGQYMITFADCGGCHTPLTQKGPDMANQYSGGHVFDIGVNKVAAANITPDSTTGIGAWTEDMFLDKFRRYRDPKAFDVDSTGHNTIMPLSILAGIKDEDLKAIYAYLRTVKPVKNKVDKYPK